MSDVSQSNPEETMRFLEAMLAAIPHARKPAERQNYEKNVACVTGVRELIKALTADECLVPVMRVSAPEETNLNRLFDFTVAFNCEQAFDHLNHLVQAIQLAQEWMGHIDGLPLVVERLLAVIVKIVEAARDSTTTIRGERAGYWLALTEEALNELKIEHGQPAWDQMFAPRLQAIHAKWKVCAQQFE